MFAVPLLRADVKVFGVAFIVLAVIAAVDLVVVPLRRRARNRASRRSHGGGHSLFE